MCKSLETGEVAQKLGALTALPEDLGLILSMHTAGTNSLDLPFKGI